VEFSGLHYSCWQRQVLATGKDRSVLLTSLDTCSTVWLHTSILCLRVVLFRPPGGCPKAFSEGLVIGLTIDPKISSTPPLYFTRGQKVQNLVSFSTSPNFEPPMKMQQDI